MSSHRSQVIGWIEQGVIKPGEAQTALRQSHVIPDSKAWQSFIDRLLLILGSLCLALALVFFIAYNWNELGRTFRFSLVGTALLLSVLAYWKLGAQSLAGKMALTVSCIVLGVLLAYFGQTYQTGADPWQLFASWAVLMLPWAIIGRFAPIWLLWLALLNVSLLLYHQVWQGILWVYFDSDRVGWILFALNGMAWIAWEWLARHISWMSPRWAVRLIAIAAGAAITFSMMSRMFEESTLAIMHWLLWGAWLAAVFYVYRRRLPDLFMLAGVCLSIIVIITLQAAYILIDSNESGIGFLVLNVLVVGQAAMAAIWLKKVHGEQHG